MPQYSTSSGAYDRVVTLQRKSVAKNDFGEPVETWGDLNTVYAQKIELTATEQVRADQVAGEITTQFVVRFNDTWFEPRLGPQDRLLYNGEGGAPEDGLAYNIRSVQDLGRRDQRLITAWTRADQGGQG